MTEMKKDQDGLAEAVCNHADLLDLYARRLSAQADALRQALGVEPTRDPDKPGGAKE